MSAISAQRPIHSQLFRFCVVGAAAFLVDASIVQLLVVGHGWNPYAGRAVSYLAAATTAWLLNRRFTFGAGSDPIHHEYAKYLVLNTAGGLVNYGTYAAMVLTWDAVRQHPVLGVAAGSIAGLVVNFALNRWLVFRRKPA